MNYKSVMQEVNELNRLMGWSDDFRFSVEVTIDNHFDESQHMDVASFVDMCVELA